MYVWGIVPFNVTLVWFLWLMSVDEWKFWFDWMWEIKLGDFMIIFPFLQRFLENFVNFFTYTESDR